MIIHMGMNEVIRQSSHGNAFCTMHDIYYLSLFMRKKVDPLYYEQTNLIFLYAKFEWKDAERHDELFNSFI